MSWYLIKNAILHLFRSFDRKVGLSARSLDWQRCDEWGWGELSRWTAMATLVINMSATVLRTEAMMFSLHASTSESQGQLLSAVKAWHVLGLYVCGWYNQWCVHGAFLVRVTSLLVSAWSSGNASVLFHYCHASYLLLGCLRQSLQEAWLNIAVGFFKMCFEITFAAVCKLFFWKAFALYSVWEIGR